MAEGHLSGLPQKKSGMRLLDGSEISNDLSSTYDLIITQPPQDPLGKQPHFQYSGALEWEQDSNILSVINNSPHHMYWLAPGCLPWCHTRDKWIPFTFPIQSRPLLFCLYFIKNLPPSNFRMLITINVKPLLRIPHSYLLFIHYGI